MINKYYFDIKTLLDCFDEGILVNDSKGRIIVNEKFSDIFNIKQEYMSEVFSALNEYGLNTFLTNDMDAETNICINNKKIRIEKFILESSDELPFNLVMIFREDDKGAEDKRLIYELKKSLNSMKDILDNAYQGIVLVDEDGTIIKWNYEKLFGIKEISVLGKPVEEVIENTRLHMVVKTGEKELCHVQRIQGQDMIASRVPIIRDGKIIGAVGTVLFKDIKEVKDLAKRLENLENDVNKYKGEISNIHYARYSFENIITQNEKMIEIKHIAKKAADSGSTILIQGDSGTGKEFFAHAIHNASKRKYAPFIRINCAAIPNELIESELFGYESGAFTGARKGGKMGKFELADKGTILLDEIGSMPYIMQAKLLRVLEEREFERLGGNKRINIDVRVIASTNENLNKKIEEGLFRQDLFYRLNVVGLNIPPLRNRIDDIPLLVKYILDQLDKNMGIKNKTITEDTLRILQSYDWPGNVRELRNILERAANISSGRHLNPEHLPAYLSKRNNNFFQNGGLLKDIVAEAEIAAIKEALRLNNGNRTNAARYLGIHRTAIYKKMNSYGITINGMECS